MSVAVLDGCIYAMGGYDGQVRQNTAERYTPKHNQWSLVTPMNHQRSDASAATCEGECYHHRHYLCLSLNKSVKTLVPNLHKYHSWTLPLAHN